MIRNQYLHKYRNLACLAVLSCLSLTSVPAWAWGGQAHAVIDRAAIDSLPKDGPTFLRRYADYIAASAVAPDTWRSATQPFSKIGEDPNHSWRREISERISPTPRSRYQYVVALYKESLRLKESDPETAKRMTVLGGGTLPYAAMEVYGHLVEGFKLLREAQAEGNDTRFIEQNCAFYVAWMGHYIGDGSQPQHDSINVSGWVGPNPNGYTTDRNIHVLFESKFVHAIDLRESDILRKIGEPAHQEGDLFTEVLEFLDEAGGHVETIYELDKRGAFSHENDREAREFVYERTATGAAMLRDMIYRAWKESAESSKK